MTEYEGVCGGRECDRTLWLFFYESSNGHAVGEVGNCAASCSTWRYSNIMLTQSLRDVRLIWRNAPAPGSEIGVVEKVGMHHGGLRWTSAELNLGSKSHLALVNQGEFHSRSGSTDFSLI